MVQAKDNDDRAQAWLWRWGGGQRSMVSQRRFVLQVELTGHTNGPHATEIMDDSRFQAQQVEGWSFCLTLTHKHSAGSHKRMDMEQPFSGATWDPSKALRQYSGPCSLKSPPGSD